MSGVLVFCNIYLVCCRYREKQQFKGGKSDDKQQTSADQKATGSIDEADKGSDFQETDDASKRQVRKIQINTAQYL